VANRVVKIFRDKNSKKIYKEGDLYEHSDADRVAFLVDSGYLEAKEVKIKFPKHTGGGWYELSNGEKVQGKGEAAAAEEELKKEGE
jgi:hypothetical protein